MTVDDPAAVSGTAPEEAACTPGNRDNTVVVVGTSCLGSGDDTLGATLMKGFLPRPEPAGASAPHHPVL